MSEPTQRTAGIETPDAEVELSAQDLLELAGPCADTEPAGGSVKSPQAPAPVPVTTNTASASASGNKPAARGYVSLALAITVLGALYVTFSPNDDASQLRSIQQPRSQLPASAAKSEGQPVLFANPFDANEVFEFPAGTSEAEAHEAVAEILMQRAQQRRQKFVHIG